MRLSNRSVFCSELLFGGAIVTHPGKSDSFFPEKKASKLLGNKKDPFNRFITIKSQDKWEIVSQLLLEKWEIFWGRRLVAIS